MARGGVRLRSNVVTDGDAWQLVPGDLLAERRPDLMRSPNRPTPLQRAEQMYYVPCGVCRRTVNVFMREGCRQCAHGPTPQQMEEARELHRRGLEAVRAARRALNGSEGDHGDA